MSKYCEQCHAELGLFNKKKVVLPDGRNAFVCKNCAANLLLETTAIHVDDLELDLVEEAEETVSFDDLPRPDGPHVIITKPGDHPEVLPLEGEEWAIGRVIGNDIQLPSSNVSKRHARLLRKDSTFILMDLKSSNGTFLNGSRIATPKPVKHGDVMKFGEYTVTLRTD